MTNTQLIEKHDTGTTLCSILSHMRSASPTYTEILAKGEKILPDILNYLRKKEAGMNIILLLQDITKEKPYQPEAGMWVDVAKYREAWIKWGIDKELIKPI